MKTRRITRPTLAELWRHLQATLEGLGVEDAPALARSPAISGLLGRSSGAMGVRVERSGEVFTITSLDPSPIRRIPRIVPCVRGRMARRRARVLTGC
jgi:hypothetical protein